MADHVHPTAFGQIAIAERALDGAGRRRAPAAQAPARDDQLRDDPLGRLRGDATYAYRHAKTCGGSARAR